MIFSLDQIIGWLVVYRYFILFPVMVLEGPIITIIAGFLSSLELLNPFLVYAVVVIADLFGDFVYYAIGRWGRKNFINKWGKYIGLSAAKIIRLESHFEKHTRKTLIFGKISHAFGAPILVAAGVAKIPFWEFIWFNFLATLPKSLIFILIGYYFGQAYVRLDKYLDYLTIGAIVLAIIILISYYLYNRFRTKFDKFIEKLNKEDVLKTE